MISTCVGSIDQDYKQKFSLSNGLLWCGKTIFIIKKKKKITSYGI